MSSSVQLVIKTAFSKAIKRAFPRIGGNVEAVIVPANPQFGDYQCNNAMALFSEFKTEAAVIDQAKNPKMVADKIDAALEKEMFDKVTVAPAGFITVKLSPQWLSSQVSVEFYLYVNYFIRLIAYFMIMAVTVCVCHSPYYMLNFFIYTRVRKLFS